MPWHVKILTLFPNLFPSTLGCSVMGNALKEKKWLLETIDIRNYALDKHKSVDDSPYGGGNGMILRADVLGNAIEKECINNGNPIIYPSPRGELFSQQIARKLIKHNGINIVCGRFEGIDHRVLEEYDIMEISIGDYVLAGGEAAALVIVEACARLLPNMCIKEEALHEESFGESNDYRHLLEYPQYTKPQIWKNRDVPPILISGNHGNIAKWRLSQAETITKKTRPDLWARYTQSQPKR